MFKRYVMIEARDKEQAVFELMRTFRLPGWDTFNNIIPYEHTDDTKPLPKKAKKKKTKKQIAAEIKEFGKELSEEEEETKEAAPEEDVGMGGKENRVYWPVGMEDWLRPKKREVKTKGLQDEEGMFQNPSPMNSAARKAITARNNAPLGSEVKEKLREATCITDVKRILDGLKVGAAVYAKKAEEVKTPGKKMNITPAKKAADKKATAAKKKSSEVLPTRGIRDLEEDDTGEDEDSSLPDLSADNVDVHDAPLKVLAPKRRSGRARAKKTSYVDANAASEEE